jgi:predicted site-specific integrase-resolvase
VGLLGEDHIKTPGGKYRYPEGEIMRLPGERAPKGKVAIYARVSSADQKEDLERQKQRLVEMNGQGVRNRFFLS